jgi:membrane-associated protease RseP (regulator of RpoE activity)
VFAYIVGVVLFALAIGIAVALHEAGHMLTAQAFGMKVRRYFIGFGPTIFSFRRGGTEYGLKAIPAGGFCDIAGMTALDEVTPEEAPKAMWRFPTWKRVVVLSAGSITHFILGFVILYLVVVSFGLPNIADKPLVGTVAQCAESRNPADLKTLPCKPGDPAPARIAGLQAGDVILSVNGTPTPTFTDVTSIVQKTHGPTKFAIDRSGTRLQLTIDVATVQSISVEDMKRTPANQKPPLSSVGMIGVVPAQYLHYGALAGFGETVNFTGQMFGNVIQGIKQFPQRIPSLINAIGGAPRDANSPMSVVGASRLGGESVQGGQWFIFWLLLATLQFFLGVFNLLPLLPLDGGHIAIALYERVRDLLRKRAGRPAAGPVDYRRLAPLTVVVVVLGGAVVLLAVTADIVNPIRLGGQ